MTPRESGIPRAAAERLSLYLRHLRGLQAEGRRTVSSSQLGEALGLGDAQVRRDLAAIGPRGSPGIGYRVPDLVSAIRNRLGTDRRWKVAIVGAGNLGSALARYGGLSEGGFRIAALFDIDPAKVGEEISELVVHPLEALEEVIRREGIVLGIVATPADAAQTVADSLVAAGVRGILNFAPRPLALPEGVTCQAVDLGIHLEQLAYRVLGPGDGN